MKSYLKLLFGGIPNPPRKPGLPRSNEWILCHHPFRRRATPSRSQQVRSPASVRWI